MFSFNNPFGACEKCTGLGTFMKVDPARVIPDKRKSIRESAIKASGWYYAEGSISEMTYNALGKRYGFTLDTPIKDFSKEALHALLYGTGEERIEMQRESMFGSGTYYNQFEGIVPNLERRFRVGQGRNRPRHVQRGLPGLPRPPPEADQPGCHGGRHQHL